MRSKKTWTATVLLALLGLGASVPSSGAEVQDSIKAWNTAWIDRDGEQIASFYAENAEVLTPSAPVVEGREEIGTMFTGMLGRRISISTEVVEELQSGDLAVVRSSWKMTIGTVDQGAQDMDDGGSIEVWQRVGDTWLLHYQTFFSTTPMPPRTYTRPQAETDGDGAQAEEAAQPVDAGTSMKPSDPPVEQR